MSNIKLIVDETNGLEITATDLALEVSESLSANIIKSGGITIPSQLFYDIIRKAPDSCNIELRKDEKVDLVDGRAAVLSAHAFRAATPEKNNRRSGGR